MIKETNTNSVCVWIKTKREAQRKRMLNKKITIQLFKENNKQISAKLGITYDIYTKNVVFSHGLYYMGNTYHPSINNKLKCIDKHTIKQYKNVLNYLSEKIRHKCISFKLDKYIRLSIDIAYNLNTNNIKVTDKIYYKSKYIITK